MTSLMHRVRARALQMPAWSTWLLMAVMFLALSTIVTARYVYAHTALSPIDEYTYVDAIDKASRGIVVRDGQLVGDLARQAISCRGFGWDDASAQTVGACGVAEPDSVYPWGAHSAGSIHSPFYYFTAAWAAKALQLVVPGIGFITAARLASGIWLGLGALVLCYLLRRLGVVWPVAVAIPVAFIAMPSFRTTNSYVTPDSFNLLAGSAILLSGWLYARREWPVWPFVVISAAATLMKLQNIFAVVAVALAIVWWAVEARVRRTQEAVRWRAVLGALVASGITGGGWLLVRSLTTIPSTGNYATDPAGHADLKAALFYGDDTLLSMLSGTIGGPYASVLPSILLWCAVGSLIALALILPSTATSAERESFGRASLVALIGVGPAVNYFFAVFFGSAVAMQPRYGLVLSPILAVALGWCSRRRSAQMLLVVFAMIAFVFAVYRPVGY